MAALSGRQAALALGCLALLGSCAAPDKPVDPPPGLPGKFTASGAQPLPEQWWRSFRDPELDRLVEQSLSGNFEFRTTWDRLAQAQAVAQREGASLWPQVEGQASASRSRITAVQEGGGGGVIGVETDDQGVSNVVIQDGDGGGATRVVTISDDFFLGLNVSYEVDVWGRIRSARDAARFDVKASGEEVAAAAITLSATVASTWYQLLEQYGQIDLLESQRETNEKVLEVVTIRFRRGQVGAADVLQQRQLVESVTGDLAVARGLAETYEHALAVLLGESPTASVGSRKARLIEISPLPATGIPLELVARRPDLRQAYDLVLASDRRLASARADRLPALRLSADLDTTDEMIRDLFDNWIATIAANLIAPIIDGGARQAEVNRTRALLSERLNAYRQAILVAMREVEDALAQERRQRQFMASLEKQLKLADSVFERIRESYIKGAVDYLRVLEAISSQQNLQRDYLTARRQLIEFRIDLCRALAGGWTMDGPPLARLIEQD